MTTVITPGAGDGVLLTQQGIGTSPGYSALDIRRLFSGALQEGVYGTAATVSAGGVSGVVAADFMVTQRASGANASVDINMPGGGMAFVQGDTIVGQGLYGVPVAAANINEVIASADLTNPRVDQVILEIQDNVLDASGGNLSRTRVLTGAPTPGATLTNRSGAATLPGSALLLADVLVPSSSGATTIPNTNIRDRRKWARGASFRIVRTAGSDYALSSTSIVAIDSTNLQPRIECSGVSLRCRLKGTAYTTSGTGVDFDIAIDGTPLVQRVEWANTAGADNVRLPLSASWNASPTAGNHLIAPVWVLASSGSGTLASSGNYPVEFSVEEILKPNAQNNNGVTSG